MADLNNLPNNSHRSREEEAVEKNVNPPEDRTDEKSKRVTSGSVGTKKTSKSKLFIKSLLVDDLHNIKDYLIWDVMIPSFRNLMYDSVENAASMLFLNGETRKNTRRDSRRRDDRDKPSYYKYYDDRDRRDDRRGSGVRAGRAFEYEELYFERRADAERVLDKMFETIDRYHMVSVADMFEFAGADRDIKYTYNDFGWLNLNDDNAYVSRHGNGDFYITLPRVRALEKN